MMAGDNDGKSNLGFLLPFIAVGIGAVILLGGLAAALKTTLPALMSLIVDSLYYPDTNFCKVRQIGLSSASGYAYFLIIISATLLYCLTAIFKKAKSDIKLPFHLSSLTSAAFIVFIIFIAAQLVHQNKYFFYIQKRYLGKTSAEKIALFYSYPYYFSLFCQQYLSVRHWGRLITDFNELEHIEPHALSYYLYPTVSFLADKKHPADCLIVFHKKNIPDTLLKDFQIIDRANKFSFLAIRNAPHAAR